MMNSSAPVSIALEDAGHIISVVQEKYLRVVPFGSRQSDAKIRCRYERHVQCEQHGIRQCA